MTNRINVYMAQTAPLIAYYKQQGVLVEVDGTQPIEQVSVSMLAVLAAR